MVLLLLNGHHPRLKFFDIFASNNGHLKASWNRDLKRHLQIQQKTTDGFVLNFLMKLCDR